MAKIRTLSTAARDIEWIRWYYGHHFAAGKRSADERFRKALRLLKDHPMAGRPHPDVEGLRLLSIAGTPFCDVYRVKDNTVTIARIYDMRGPTMSKTQP